jgi:hypothetical protein
LGNSDTITNLHSKISRQHVLPCVRVPSLREKSALYQVDLRVAELNRPKKENPMLLHQLSTLRSTVTCAALTETDFATAAESGTTTELVPQAGWTAVCQKKLSRRMSCIKFLFYIQMHGKYTDSCHSVFTKIVFIKLLSLSLRKVETHQMVSPMGLPCSQCVICNKFCIFP